MSASTDAITSAFPVLHEYRVLIALFMIAIVTVVFLPIVIFIFRKINQHYRDLANELRLDMETDKSEPLSLFLWLGFRKW